MRINPVRATKLMIYDAPYIMRERLQKVLGDEWRVENYGCALTGTRFDAIVVISAPISEPMRKFLQVLPCKLPPGEKVIEAYD